MFLRSDQKYNKPQNEKLKKERGHTPDGLLTHFILNKVQKRKDKGTSCNINIWSELLAISIQFQSIRYLGPIFLYFFFFTKEYSFVY